MSSPLRILYLENDLADTELVQATLEVEGIACNLTRVETEPDFVAALEQGGFDLILADYTLPSFDGISALRIARQQRPGLPFIFVSGTLGEEVAIEALKIGATDYVLKSRLSRLVPSVQRAMREAVERAKRKRAEEDARRSEKELRDLIAEMPAMAFSIRPDGSTEFASRRWKEYVGLSEEATAGEGWKVAVHSDDLEPHLSKWHTSLASGEPFENEVRIKSATGEYRWFLIRAVPLSDEQGRIVKWYGTSTDIEDRKRAEALLTGEKRILEMVANGDSLAQILDSLCRLVEEQASGVLASILLVDGTRLRHGGAPSLPKAYTEAIDGVAIGPSVGSCGTAAYRGEQVIVEDIATDPLWTDYREAALPHSLRSCWSTPVFSSQGKVIATFAMYYREPRSPSLRDQEFIEHITDLAGVAIERKLTQDALRRSEAYLNEGQTLTRTGSWAYDIASQKAIYWSEEMFRIFGCDPQRRDPLNHEEFLRLMHPEDRDGFRRRLDNAIREKVERVEDYRLVMSDGTIKHIHEIEHAVRDQNGEVVEFFGTSMDVTERKRAEEALRRSEAYLAEAQRLSKTGSWAWSPITRESLYWSEEMFRIFGLDPQQGLPPTERFWDRVHPQDRDRVNEIMWNAVRAKAEYAHDHRIVLSDGTVKHIHAIGLPLLDGGKVVEYVGTLVDVTEQVRNRQALETAFEEIKVLKDQLYKENLALRDEVDRASMFEEIVGASPALQNVLAQVARVGPTDSTVLITGETGTGKELFARAIHKRSRRSGRAFISVNCAALAPSLISSELFGHEKGAFTGATQRRLGRFELADGGTIFLDEVGELPPETQVALLRVLQEREFERVGGTQSVQADVRVIAATNRDLEAATSNGTFRQDLFYRLNVFPIDVPPLMERRDDILMLVEYFVQRYARAAGKQIGSIDKNTLELFQSYDWPGNIRELQNVIERSVILTSGDVLRVDESWLYKEPSQRATRVQAPPSSDDEDRGEREIIVAALTESRGRVAGPNGAAAKLGIPPSTLESKIKALKIRKSQFKFR